MPKLSGASLKGGVEVRPAKPPAQQPCSYKRGVLGGNRRRIPTGDERLFVVDLNTAVHHAPLKNYDTIGTSDLRTFFAFIGESIPGSRCHQAAPSKPVPLQ